MIEFFEINLEDALDAKRGRDGGSSIIYDTRTSNEKKMLRVMSKQVKKAEKQNKKENKK